MQKINDLCPTNISGISEADQLKIIEKAEDKACQKSEWVFHVNEVKWVECFKKTSNLDSKLKGRKNNFEETICVKPPFQSDKLMKYFYQKDVRCSLSYLEYMTLKCNM